MNIKTILNQAIETLNKIETAKLDARILLQHAANITVETIYLQPELEINEEIAKLYFSLIDRRANNEPVAKIIGKKAFWENDFIVNQHTLDPRPDSEVIISATLELFLNKNANLKFLDLGTGSGCLILSLLQEYKNSSGIGSDISSEALKVTQQNIKNLSLEDRIILIQQNWADSIIEKFDLIISNPPYIPSEDIASLSKDVRLYDPLLALDGGEDGLDPYRYLAKQIFNILKKDAYAILEFGYGQGLYIKQIFENAGYIVHKILIDLAGIERAIIVRKNYESREIY